MTEPHPRDGRCRVADEPSDRRPRPPRGKHGGHGSASIVVYEEGATRSFEAVSGGGDGTTHEQPMHQENDMRHLHNDTKSVLGVVLTAVLACSTAPAWASSTAPSPSPRSCQQQMELSGFVGHELSALAGMGQWDDRAPLATGRSVADRGRFPIPPRVVWLDLWTARGTT